MYFLKDMGFDDSLIDKLSLKYDEGIIDVMILKKKNVSEVISYFRKIGILDIEGLLVFRLELFLKDIQEIKDAFSKKDIISFVREINEDIISIDQL